LNIEFDSDEFIGLDFFIVIIDNFQSGYFGKFPSERK